MREKDKGLLASIRSAVSPVEEAAVQVDIGHVANVLTGGEHTEMLNAFVHASNGALQHHVLKTASHTTHVISGPDHMVDAVRSKLSQMGAKSE